MCKETRKTPARKSAALLGIAALFNLIALSPVLAERITGGELAESCQALLASDDHQAGSLCRAFVHGYLMGAGKLQDGIGKGNETGEEDEDEGDFTERAMETRINPDLLEEVQAGPGPEFCLGESVELADVAQVIAVQLGPDRDTAEMPEASAVRRALAREFPCGD